MTKRKNISTFFLAVLHIGTPLAVLFLACCYFMAVQKVAQVFGIVALFIAVLVFVLFLVFRWLAKHKY